MYRIWENMFSVCTEETLNNHQEEITLIYFIEKQKRFEKLFIMIVVDLTIR